MPEPAPSRLPEGVADGSLALRRWLVEEAELLHRAVRANLEHLRPWMPWVAGEPLTLRQRRALIAGWEDEWAAGGDVVLGVFVNGAVVGGSGLHRRIGPDGLELGYWIDHAHLRQGLATRVAGLLTTLAFSVAGITRVEIHHDRANLASAGVARKLGFVLDAEERDRPEAPGEEGVEWRWRMDAAHWSGRGGAGGATPPA